MVNFDNFQWINRGDVRVDGDRIVMTAPALTDFFCGGETSSEEGILPESLCNAPYYHTEIEGDFVLQVKVSHPEKSLGWIGGRNDISDRRYARQV